MVVVLLAAVAPDKVHPDSDILECDGRDSRRKNRVHQRVFSSSRRTHHTTYIDTRVPAAYCSQCLLPAYTAGCSLSAYSWRVLSHVVQTICTPRDIKRAGVTPSIAPELMMSRSFKRGRNTHSRYQVHNSMQMCEYKQRGMVRALCAMEVKARHPFYLRVLLILLYYCCHTTPTLLQQDTTPTYLPTYLPTIATQQ